MPARRLTLAIACAMILSGCTTAPRLADYRGWNGPVVPTDPTLPQIWKFALSWSCNAESGKFGQNCRGTRDVPLDDASNPPGLIHCKTDTVVLKRDAGGNTAASWLTYREDSGRLIFRHAIRAESDFFGGGKEISVSYVHILIRPEDAPGLKDLLGCTFTREEHVSTYPPH